MSEAQALTESEEVDFEEELTEEVEELEDSEQPSEDDDEEVEIVAEGEDEPPSKPSKKNRVPRRIGKLKQQLEEKDSNLERLEQKIAMQEEELRLIRLSGQKTNSNERPSEDDFDSLEDYRAAETKWLRDQINSAAEAKTQEQLRNYQSHNTQQRASQELDNSIDQHYDRAEKLKVSDYSETEGVAANIFGDKKSKVIIANTDRSELLMYHLGKNPVKAEKYSAMLDNPATMVRALMELGGIANKLTAVPKSKIAPDPETVVEGGNSSPLQSGPKGATFE